VSCTRLIVSFGLILLAACQTVPLGDEPAGDLVLREAVRKQSQTRLTFETNAVGRPVRIHCANRLRGFASKLRPVIAEIDSEIQRVIGIKLAPDACDIYLAAFSAGGPAPRHGSLLGAVRGQMRLMLPVHDAGVSWLAPANAALADGVLAGLAYTWTRRALAPLLQGEDRRWVLEGVSLYVAWRIARQVDKPTAGRMKALWMPIASLDRARVRQSLLWWDGPVAPPIWLHPRETLDAGPDGSELARARRGAALRLMQQLVELAGQSAIVQMIRRMRQWVKPGDATRLFHSLTGQTIDRVGTLSDKQGFIQLARGIEQISRGDAAERRWGLAFAEHLGRKYEVASKATYPQDGNLPRYIALVGTMAAESLLDKDPAVQVAAARASGALGRAELDDYLLRELDNLLRSAPESALRMLADLAHAKRAPARAILFGLLLDRREPVRREAVAALRQSTGRAFDYDHTAPQALRADAIERWRTHLDALERGGASKH